MFAQETISALMRNEANVSSYFVEANKWWSEILNRQGNDEPTQLAEIISKQFLSFVISTSDDDRFLIKEIIGIVAIARFWTPNDGFGSREARARQVYDGIRQSSCSGEIKESATDAAKAYGLID
jgi:hypothetical protein